MLKTIGKSLWLASIIAGFGLSISLIEAHYWLACLVMLATMTSVLAAIRAERKSRKDPGAGPVVIGDRC
jgi:hypothetical protein